MLSYAIDNPAPSTIFLITGDRDFAYALSTLKNRHYRVILVKRPDTHVSLTFQACICFDWFDDVVHQAENPSSQAEQSPQRLPYQRHRHSDSQCNTHASASGPSPHSTTEDDFGSGTGAEEIADTAHFLRDSKSGLPPAFLEHPQDREVPSSAKQGRGPLLSTRRNSISNFVLVQEKTQQIPLHAAKPRTQSEPHHTTLREDTLAKNSLPVRSRSADMGDEVKADLISSASPISWPIFGPSPSPPTTPKSTMARRIMHEETGKSIKATRSTGDPPMSVEELAGKFLKKEPLSNMNPSRATLATRSPSSKSSISGTSAVKPALLKPRDAKPANPPTRSEFEVNYHTRTELYSDCFRFWTISSSSKLCYPGGGPPMAEIPRCISTFP